MLLVFLCSLPAWAESITLTTYVPAPIASYDQFRLVPKSAGQDLTGDCTSFGTGTMYMNSSNQLQFCKDGVWGSLATGGGTGGLWEKNGNDVYLKDSDTNPDLFVGIGTKTPEFKLSLEQDGGIIAKGAIDSGEVLTTTGAGTRMIWYPRKAAFRAGEIHAMPPDVPNTLWNDVYIGQRSVATGLNTLATQLDSIAFGNQASAINQEAIAFGPYGTASGRASICMGKGLVPSHPVASGDNSIALGEAFSVGPNSIGIGRIYGMGGGALGTNSITIGVNSGVVGNNSIALGNQVSVHGDSSVGIGTHC